MLAGQRGAARVLVVDEELEHLLLLFVRGGDLSEPIFVPLEERGPDAAAPEGRVDEAALRVGARAIDFLIPPHATVGNRSAVHLRDEQVALGVGAFQMRVVGCDSLCRLDPVRALAFGEGRDEAGEVRIVGLSPERPEDGDLERGKLGHVLILPLHRSDRVRARGSLPSRAPDRWS